MRPLIFYLKNAFASFSNYDEVLSFAVHFLPMFYSPTSVHPKNCCARPGFANPCPMANVKSPDVQGKMSNVQMSSVRCGMPCVQCQIPCVQCQMSSGKCPVSSVQCPMSNVKCQMSNVQCKMSKSQMYKAGSSIILQQHDGWLACALG